MRDAETAQMGIQASLTGHLVFSTLHTNDAPGAITRMIDMGVPAYLVSSSIIAVLAQRLIWPVVCAKCKQPFQPSEAALEAAGITPEMAAKATFMKGKGCNHCGGNGYRGRLGVFEMMIMSLKNPRAGLLGRGDASDPARGGKSSGMTTLYNDGIQKVLKASPRSKSYFARQNGLRLIPRQTSARRRSILPTATFHTHRFFPSQSITGTHLTNLRARFVHIRRSLKFN